jgi:serine O-acetyltransferase
VSPDWSRERKSLSEWSPSRSLLASIRSYQTSRFLPLRKLAVLRHRFWSVITGTDIPINCRLGGGLLIPHPNGIVIHQDAVVGPNCLIFQQVTLGSVDDRGPPRVGAYVDIGAGAKILGPVVIGDHARIGANAVVLHDVPAYASVVGIPARIVRKYDRNRT